tara:strand:+ start:758 stop:2065 length:1308 start_codon:yes stop_codon:yes gene_type:complete
MPKMGESIMEATILKWLKKEGDNVALDEPVLEIATDKVDSEVPSPVEGVMGASLFEEGAIVEVGATIAHIITEGSSGEVEAQAPAEAEAPTMLKEEKQSEVISENTSETTTVLLNSEGSRFYSPLVLSIARKEKISMDELESVPGTGRNGRLTKKDILGYLKNGRKNHIEEPIVAPKVAAVPNNPVSSQVADSVSVSAGQGVEIIEMDRMRKLIADHMVQSKQTSPHVTSFVEADVTNIVNWRNKVKTDFQKREGEKITFTPIFVEAMVKAARDFPMINVSIKGNEIHRYKSINIGMAAALPSGNLIVPVIKNADSKNLLGLVRDVNDLALRARTNKLKPNEIEGGTITLTNVGTFGNLMGTPIINQPQVAILATGSIKKKPVVIETSSGDLIGIRHMMFLSLSYDHRVVDGALGGSYLRRVADYLEQFNSDQSI